MRSSEAPKRLELAIKRAYAGALPSDGYRVLVDRLWPRGLSKDDLAVREWLKEVAPSDELRTYFHHDVARWDEFVDRYHNELKQPEVVATLERIADKAAEGPVTLVYAAADEEHNNAVVLREAIQRTAARSAQRAAPAPRSGTGRKATARPRRPTLVPRRV